MKLSSLRVFFGAAVLLLVSGCSSLGFYAQAVSGHMALMRARVPVDDALNDESLSAALRDKLLVARSARAFAIDTLGLPDNGSYTTWVALKRPAVTWNVVATQPYSMQPERWCFPVAGCLSYRGYFKREDANAFAASLAEQGLDVTIGGSTAYSSLGWFEDPLVSTMFRSSDAALAGVLFHELAHQQLYIQDDSSFNESFASFVEVAGVKRWLAQTGQLDAAKPWHARRAIREAFVALLADTRQRLQKAFSEETDVAVLEEVKTAEYQRLKANYLELKASWNGYSGYDGWFERPVNNARLAGVGTYTQWIEAFAAVFDQVGSEFRPFYDAASALGQLPTEERNARLRALSTE